MHIKGVALHVDDTLLHPGGGLLKGKAVLPHGFAGVGIVFLALVDADGEDGGPHARLLQDRGGYGQVAAIAVVHGDENRFFRQGRPFPHIADHLRDGHRLIARFAQGRHLLPEPVGGDHRSVFAGLIEVVVHQDRESAAVAAVCHTAGIHNLKGQKQRQRRYDRNLPIDPLFTHAQQPPGRRYKNPHSQHCFSLYHLIRLLSIV